MPNYYKPEYYVKADYLGFMVPRSEGGKGPENARELLGLEFEDPSGMKVQTFMQGETVGQCAYRYFLSSHPKARAREFTADNHTWATVAGKADHLWSNLSVKRVSLFGNQEISNWFSQEYRVATIGMIAAEIDCDRQTFEKYREAAAQQHDSVPGRKRARKFRLLSNEANYRAEVAPDQRWPDVFRKPTLVFSSSDWGSGWRDDYEAGKNAAAQPIWGAASQSMEVQKGSHPNETRK